MGLRFVIIVNIDIVIVIIIIIILHCDRAEGEMIMVCLLKKMCIHKV
jgi:hypothetical protein